jgi:hypothetical protein
MSLADYFENTKGMGVLATADSAGKVDAAVYARPHVQDETTVAFIMRDKLSYKNLCTNPSALYLFVEKGEGYVGKRLHLTKLRQESAPEAIDAVRRGRHGHGPAEEGQCYLVYFRIDQIRPLVGD